MVRSRPGAIGKRWPAQPTTYYLPRTTHYSLLTTHHSPLTTHHSLLTTHHSPLTTHHSPLTTHHPPQVKFGLLNLIAWAANILINYAMMDALVFGRLPNFPLPLDR